MPVVVAFISQKGGVGKSTLARALAAVAAHAKLKVTAADLDPQQQTLVLWEQARARNHVSPAVSVEAFADADAAIAGAADADLLILDTPGYVSDPTLAIAKRAHVVVQPTGPSLDDLRPAVLVFHALTNLGVPRERLVFALCRTLAKAEEDAARKYLEQAGFRVLPGAIPERIAYRQALNRGQGLTETAEPSANKRADALIEGLLEMIAVQFEQPARSTSKRGKAGGEP